DGRGGHPPPGHAAGDHHLDGEAPRARARRAVGRRSVMSTQMESWSWPPRYDDSYRPDPKSRFWFPVRETMDPGARERAILGRLREITSYAYARSPFYKAKWDQAGFHPEQITSLEAFEEKCPTINKADLRASQAKKPPFGEYVCVEE